MTHNPSDKPNVLDHSDSCILICAPKQMTKKQIKKWANKEFTKLDIAKSWKIYATLNLFGPNGTCGKSSKHRHYFLQPSTNILREEVITMPKNNNYDADGRELIGKVVLSSGEEVKVYMPLLGDYFKWNFNSSVELVPHLMSAATHKTIDELNKLSYPDGLSIMEKLAPALKSANDYLTKGPHEKKGK